VTTTMQDGHHSVAVDGATRYYVVSGAVSARTANVLVLHASARVGGVTWAPAVDMQRRMAHDAADAWPGATVAYLAGRDVGNGLWCWGAGYDNDLCSAAVDGSDARFVAAVVAALASSAPVYLYGYSGGARMAWRLACDALVAPLLDGVAAASGLLPAGVRAAGCSLDTAPPAIVVVHGSDDGTTSVEHADASLRWLAANASCTRADASGVAVGEDLADLQVLRPCADAERLAVAAYYRVRGGQHSLPSRPWLQAVWLLWEAHDGPGVAGATAGGAKEGFVWSTPAVLAGVALLVAVTGCLGRVCWMQRKLARAAAVADC